MRGGGRSGGPRNASRRISQKSAFSRRDWYRHRRLRVGSRLTPVGVGSESLPVAAGVCWLPLNWTGVHYGSQCNGSAARAVEQGKDLGQKAPLRLKEIWALRVRLQMENRVREVALFNLGLDSKLRGCDLVSLRVRDVCHGEQVAQRAIVMQLSTPTQI